jgi:hypothetical protein
VIRVDISAKSKVPIQYNIPSDPSASNLLTRILLIQKRKESLVLKVFKKQYDMVISVLQEQEYDDNLSGHQIKKYENFKNRLLEEL